MDDLEDKTKRNTNSAGESRQLRPDPIVQASDDYSRPHEGMQPTEIIPTAKKPISAANATLLPNQFMGTGGPTQAVPPGSDIIESMFRFKWTVLAVFILVAAPAIAVIWTQVVPKYRARAEVRVRPIIPYLVFRTEDSGMIPLYSSFVNTQVSIIEGLVVLQRALDQEEVQETQWYKEPPKPLVQRLHGNPADPPMERLRDALSVKPRKETEIIDVTFMDPSAKDAKLIVDAVLDQYVKYIGEKSDATKDKLYSQLADQYKSLENEILGREKISAELSRSLGTGTPQELVSGKRVRLDETQARLSELRQSIAVLEWKRKKLEDLIKQAITDDSNDVPGGTEKQPKYYEDAEWRRLDINVKTIRHQIATSLLTSKHPDNIQAKKDLEFTEELLRLREAQLDEQWRDRPKNAAGVPITITGAGGPGYEEELRTLEHQLAQIKYEEQLLLAELKEQQAEFQGLFESAQLLEKENNALQHKRELFSAVRQRLDQKNMERNIPGSIEVLTQASVSSKPYNDRRITFTAMALVMGLGMGGGVAFLRAGRNQAIYTPKDMPHPMQVPFLGYIPVTRTRRASDDEVSPAMIESIRFVRTALLSRLDGQGSTTVLVTSADAGTGKTTFTMMLGKSLAQAGKKVLMMDADFQKMTLTKRLNLSDKSGFVESLRCRSIATWHIFPTETSGLSIMPAGNRGDDGAVFEEIANGAFETCIGQLREQYNIILLDSSPILTLADATILSSYVDGTIMVERELVSRRADVISALAHLGSAGGRLLGTVFIGSSSHEKYGYHYHYNRTSESYL
ncbi:MAG: AAA family ATPase [Planctomycetota bacterium]